MLLVARRLPRGTDRTRPQPIRCPGGGWLLLNGEVYNYRALAGRLGINPDGLLDSEVLALWVSRHGVDGIEQIQGEYAFAFCDGEARSVLIARDGFGSRPLYWATRGESFAFGSSARGVSLLLDNKLSLDDCSTSDFLWYSVSPSGHCFRGVNSVKAGEALVIHNGDVQCLRCSRESGGIDTSVAPNIEVSLRRSVAARTEGNRSWLSYSGGLDSSLLRHFWPHKQALQAYHIALDGEVGLNGATRVSLTQAKLIAQVSRFAEVSERPITSLSGVGMTLLAIQAVADGNENQLSGEGADEVFLGYPHYLAHSSGHPLLLSQARDKAMIEQLYGLDGGAKCSIEISELQSDPSASSWWRFDRYTRLPEHLCQMNGDRPTLLAGAESRLPFIDLADVHPPALSETFELKRDLKQIAREHGLPIPAEKRGLFVPCGLIGEEWVRDAAEEVSRVAGLPFCLGDHRTLVDRIDHLIKMLPAMPDALAAYLWEITARWIVGLWSARFICHVPHTSMPRSWVCYFTQLSESPGGIVVPAICGYAFA